jgi:hypothetical protein
MPIGTSARKQYERQKATLAAAIAAAAELPCACAPPWRWCLLHFEQLSDEDQARVRRGAPAAPVYTTRTRSGADAP